MKISQWALKYSLMAPFSVSKLSENVYEWLTAELMGTQLGMSRKWCYWFREHVLLCRRYAHINFFGKRIWLFQPGWSLAPVILSRMATSSETLVFEERKKLGRRYLEPALSEVNKVASIIVKSSNAPESNLLLLDELQNNQEPFEILNMCRAKYITGSLDKLEPESADICFSMGRLEHFSQEELSGLLDRMKSILVPGGIASHIVDHRDHFWHYDKSIHCFHHLTFSEKKWKTLARGRKLYRNRLLEPDYISLFNEAGFEVLASVHDLHKQDAYNVDPRTFWGPFAELTPKDLEAAVSHFVLRLK